MGKKERTTGETSAIRRYFFNSLRRNPRVFCAYQDAVITGSFPRCPRYHWENSAIALSKIGSRIPSFESDTVPFLNSETSSWTRIAFVAVDSNKEEGQALV